jgi:hypothetical protein
VKNISVGGLLIASEEVAVIAWLAPNRIKAQKGGTGSLLRKNIPN